MSRWAQRWTEADVRNATGRIQQLIATATEGRQSRSKYNNIRCVFQGETFDSKRELERYKEFKLQQLAGEIRAVVRQVSFCLPGTKRRIRIDFLVVELDGRNHWYDAKGYETEAWKLKRVLVKDALGIEIKLI